MHGQLFLAMPWLLEGWYAYSQTQLCESKLFTQQWFQTVIVFQSWLIIWWCMQPPTASFSPQGTTNIPKTHQQPFAKTIIAIPKENCHSHALMSKRRSPWTTVTPPTHHATARYPLNQQSRRKPWNHSDDFSVTLRRFRWYTTAGCRPALGNGFWPNWSNPEWMEYYRSIYPKYSKILHQSCKSFI